MNNSLKHLFRISFFVLSLLQFENSSAQNKVLIEKFSNTGCAPCLKYKPKFDSIVNSRIDKITLIEYRTSWPGVDAFYNMNVNDNRERVIYYEVTGIPMIQVNGKMYFTNEFTSELIDSLYSLKTPIELKAAFSLKTDTVTAILYLKSNVEMKGNFRLYAMACGGEYGNILRQSLSTVTGAVKIQELKKDFQGDYSFNGVFINSKYFNANKTKVICFLQNIETKEVVVSCYAILK